MEKTFNELTADINNGYNLIDDTNLDINADIVSTLKRLNVMLDSTVEIQTMSYKKKLTYCQNKLLNDSLGKKAVKTIKKAIKVVVTCKFKKLDDNVIIYLSENLALNKIIEILDHLTNAEITSISEDGLDTKGANTLLKKYKTRKVEKTEYTYEKKRK